jgi:hypothetical protein
MSQQESKHLSVLLIYLQLSKYTAPTASAVRGEVLREKVTNPSSFRGGNEVDCVPMWSGRPSMTQQLLDQYG